MSRALVTGFEPFGDVHHNPSAAILERLPASVDGVQIERRLLPVDTRRVRAQLLDLTTAGYRLVLHLGVAKDRRAITLERQAVNHCDFPIPDNGGVTRKGAIVPDGPDRITATLPITKILEAWHAAGIDAAPSDSAGRYLCNQVMYETLHQMPAETPCGFIHLPPDETLSPDGAHQTLATQVDAVIRALEVTIRSCRPLRSA